MGSYDNGLYDPNDELEQLGLTQDEVDEYSRSLQDEHGPQKYARMANKANRNKLYRSGTPKEDRHDIADPDNYDQELAGLHKDASELGSLRKKLRSTADAAHKEDGGQNLFYTGSGGLGGGKGGKGLGKKVMGAAGVGGFIVSVLIGMFSFLNFFQLDHILSNIDIQTFTKFNAQFSRRSNDFLKGYLRARADVFNGNLVPDADGNIYFRGKNDTTLNPIKKGWYNAMLKNEANVFGDDIAFVGGSDANGRPIARRLVLKDGAEIDFDLRDNPELLNDPAKIKEIDDKLDSEIFKSDKDARQALKRDLRERTKFYEVLKRRRTRKVIQQMTGIRDWRLFEKTRGKLETKVANVQGKILKKVFPDSTALGKFVNCLFGQGECTGRDPENPDNKHQNSNLRSKLDQEGG